MRTHRNSKLRAVVVGGACAVVGVIGGIAGAAAAPSSHGHVKRTHRSASQLPTTTTSTSTDTAPPFRAHPGGGPPVHEDAVVLDKAGTGFITETVDNGAVQSVSGSSLTIREGVGKVTYKTVTLTIPAGATIVRNFTTASLSDLKSGDRVHVSQSSEGTTVFAFDASLRPPDGPGRGDGRGPGGHDGPGGWGGPGGPPGAWGGPGDGTGGPGGTGSTTTTTTSSATTS